MTERGAGVWPPYLWWSLALATTSGFGLGGGLYAASAFHIPAGVWWPTLAQAHGHSQLFGFVGLLVAGTLLHFLPRLRGAPLWRPGAARLALTFYAAGLVARIISQPLTAASMAPAAMWRAALATSGVFELIGAGMMLAMLGLTAREGPPLARRPGFRGALPLFSVAALGFASAALVNAAGAATAALLGDGLVPLSLDYWTTRLFLYAFLVPVAVTMSSRLFPLYFRAPPGRGRQLLAGLACLMAGIALGGPGLAAPWPALGSGARGLALLCFVAGTRIFARRQPLPRGQTLPRDAVWYHARAASGWLVVAALGLLGETFAMASGGRYGMPAGLETHLVGSGYLTLLILGIGAKMLPGFARRPLRSQSLVWVTLVTGNASTLLRAGPLVLPAAFPGPARELALASAGLFGVVALGVFGWNLRGRGDVARPGQASMR